jgi:hypothetical protein
MAGRQQSVGPASACPRWKASARSAGETVLGGAPSGEEISRSTRSKPGAEKMKTLLRVSAPTLATPMHVPCGMNTVAPGPAV